jgi:hypothetical protein
MQEPCLFEGSLETNNMGIVDLNTYFVKFKTEAPVLSRSYCGVSMNVLEIARKLLARYREPDSAVAEV